MTSTFRHVLAHRFRENLQVEIIFLSFLSVCVVLEAVVALCSQTPFINSPLLLLLSVSGAESIKSQNKFTVS